MDHINREDKKDCLGAFSINEIELLEIQLIGSTVGQVSEMLGLRPISIEVDQVVYVVSTYFWNLLKRRLFIYIENDVVRDYYIGIF